MVDFNPYIQIQPVQQVRRPQTLAGVQATGQVVAQPFELGKALGHLASSLAGVSKQKVAEEEQERKRAERDQQIATVQADAERLTEKQLGEIVHNRVKNGELPAGYDPFMMDLLERQAGRRAFRAFRSKADEALKSFNDPDFAGDPQEVFAQIQADVLAEYGAADQGAKFLGEFVTLRGELRDAWTTNAVNSRSNARQSQAIDGFADDVSVALQEFGNDAGSLNNALANLMQEAAGSSVFVGYPKGKLSQIIAATVQAEAERLIKLEDFEEARTLLDNFRTLNPRSRRLNGTPGDDESTDIRQPNSFAYDHGALISTIEASLEDKEAQVERRDGLKNAANAGTTANQVAAVIRTSPEFYAWLDGLPVEMTDAEVRTATREWLTETGFNLDGLASFQDSINDKVKALVLGDVQGIQVRNMIQAERIQAFRSGGEFEGIMAMPLDYSVAAAETAMRREARAAGIGEPGVQSLIELVRNDRDRRRGEVVSPTSEVLNQKKASTMLVEFRNDTQNMTPEELRRAAAERVGEFLELGDRFAVQFLDAVNEEEGRRRDIGERRLREKAYPIKEKGDLAAVLVTNELQVLLEAAGLDAKEVSDQANREITLYQTRFVQELEDAIRDVAYNAPDQEVEQRMAEVMRSYGERAKTEAAEFAKGLMRGRAKITTGRTTDKGGQQTVPIRSTFGGLFGADNDDINDYLSPLQTAAPDRTAPVAWQEVWKKDKVYEYGLEVDSAKQAVRKALSGDYSLTLSGGKFVKGDNSWFTDDLDVDEATNAAAMTHIDDILNIYSPINGGSGRNIHRGFGAQRLDKFGVEINPALLNPERVPVLSAAALADPEAQRVIEEYNAALTDNRITDAEGIIKEWLAGDSISAEEYNLLLPQYQQNPGPIWARQEQFYRAWESTQNN